MKDEQRADLLDIIHRMPDTVMERHSELLYLLAECPEWCIAPHGPSGHEEAHDWHYSEDAGLETVDLALYYAPSELPPNGSAPKVRLDDRYLNPTLARSLAETLLKYADIIDPPSAPLSVAQ